MKISLAPEMDQWIAEKVKSGLYKSRGRPSVFQFLL